MIDRPSERLKNWIKSFEGLHDGDLRIPHLQPKMDPAGIWTIGWGHAIKHKGKLISGSRNKKLAYSIYPSMTMDEAEQLLEDDLMYYIRVVSNLVHVTLNQNQKDALYSLTYNIGGTNLSTSTLLKRVNKNPLDKDIAYQFSRWKFSKGKEYPGLVKRRKVEADIYFTPVDS